MEQHAHSAWRISAFEAEEQMLDIYRHLAAEQLGLPLRDRRVENAAQDAYWNDAPGQTREWTAEEVAAYNTMMEHEESAYLEWRKDNNPWTS